MENKGHKAVKGDTLEIEYGNGIHKKIKIGEGKYPGLEFACVGKERGDTVEYLNTTILIKEIYPNSDEPQKDGYVPKVTNFFSLPQNRQTKQYEEIKFGIVNDVTEWELNALLKEQKDEQDENDENSVHVLGHNTVKPHNYTVKKSTIDSDVEQCRSMRKRPYGGRIDYLNEKTNEVVTIYFTDGKRIEDEKGVHVLNWKDKFQQVGSCDEYGRTQLSRNKKYFSDENLNGQEKINTIESLFNTSAESVECNGIQYKLQLKRLYTFDNWEKGVEYREDYITVIDSLLETLKQKRGESEMSSIVYSIQEKQREIMYLQPEKNLIIQGCAGSGKTMILMHRISYLIGSNSGLKAQNALFLTPSEAFINSINSLSRTLEISKVKTVSIDVYYQELILKYISKYRFEGYLEDEAKLYTVDTLQKAYTEQTFEKILKEEDACVQANREEIEGDFLKIESLLKRNKIKQTPKKDKFQDYLEGSRKTLTDLQKKLGEQTASIKTVEEKIKNDEKRVGESRKTA